jgi:RimJ/RimL family protein N-acetyltransferase
MEIRNIEPHDFSAVIALEKANWTTKSTPVMNSISQESFEKKLLSGAQYLLALDNDNLLGVLDYSPRHPNLESSHHVWTFGLVVDKASRRQGIATALIQKFLQVSRETNVKKITINVLGTNPEAIALYEKLGFVRIATLKDEFYIEGHYIDDLLYSYFLWVDR